VRTFWAHDSLQRGTTSTTAFFRGGPTDFSLGVEHVFTGVFLRGGSACFYGMNIRKKGNIRLRRIDREVSQDFTFVWDGTHITMALGVFSLSLSCLRKMYKVCKGGNHGVYLSLLRDPGWGPGDRYIDGLGWRAWARSSRTNNKLRYVLYRGFWVTSDDRRWNMTVGDYVSHRSTGLMWSDVFLISWVKACLHLVLWRWDMGGDRRVTNTLF